MKKTRTSTSRKLAIYGFELVTGGHNFFALLDLDITNLRKYLREKRREGTGGSLFALILKAIGKCLHEFPEFNSMINLKNTTYFDQVDIAVPVEIEHEGKFHNRQYIIRDINNKTITEVDDEINAAKTLENDDNGFESSKTGQWIIKYLPSRIFMFVFRRILKNHESVRNLSGTVFVTSVSMFSNVPGYIIPYIGGPKAVSFAIGSTGRKPVVAGDEIRIREMINVTAIFNHDLINGAVAARFLNRFRNCLEKSYGALIR
jgi:pyruvate/2-oxoglutarate dehydrogenase complex dihydrolipoamide acyltransferase (E2) component